MLSRWAPGERRRTLTRVSTPYAEDPFGLADLPDEPPPALGTVAEQDRGSLPFALLHGEALVVCAAWALGEAGVHLVDTGTPWSSVAAAHEPFVLHDSLCPMTPPEFLTACVREALDSGEVVVGVRAVTDTVKRVEDGVVGGTVDRDAVWAVASPLVLPPAVVAALEDGPTALSPGLDLAELVAALGARGPVRHLEAPDEGRRVSSAEDVEVLAALTAPR